MVDDDNALKAPLDLPEDTTHHVPPAHSPKRPKKGGKTFVIILLVALVLAALGFAGWKFTRPKPASQATTNSDANTPAQPAETDYTAATGTKTYTNDVMRLSFTYPDNWTVTETDNTVRVESPNFTYETLDKGNVTGNFRIYIRQGAQAADSKYIGEGVAILPSEKLVYAQPTATQRKDTYLSSFGLDTPDNYAFFLIAGNFNLKKGDTLGPNYGKEPDTFIIGGGYSSKDLKEGLETNKVPVDDFQESTAYKQAVDILKSIQIK
jgi:hypothetical protein